MRAEGWPMFFAKRALRSRNLNVQAGEPFPIQDIRTIRGYGAAYGVPDADRLPLTALDFVEVIDVRDRQMARHVLQQGLAAKTVRKLLGEAEAA